MSTFRWTGAQSRHRSGTLQARSATGQSQRLTTEVLWARWWSTTSPDQVQSTIPQQHLILVLPVLDKGHPEKLLDVNPALTKAQTYSS